jgi:CRISPR-associated protein Cas1
MIFLQYGQVDVLDGAFVLIDKTGIRTHIPVGSVACIMLEPGTRVSHAAVRLAAVVGTLLVWVGEAGVRVYASGQPGGARADKLLYQAKLALDDDLRLKVVRKCMNCVFVNHRRHVVLSSSCAVLKGLASVRLIRYSLNSMV